MLPQYIRINPFPQHDRIPHPEREEFLCNQLPSFLPRALEAHENVRERYMIDPRVTVTRINELEAFAEMAEGILTEHYTL
jgi:hypothetical protein